MTSSPPDADRPPLVPAVLSRRALLGAALAGLGALVAGPALARSAPARKAKQDPRALKVRDIETQKGLGYTLTLELEKAPFPHRGARYRDATVLVFVPHYYRVRAGLRVDTLVHFHGYRDTAREAMLRHQMREQLVASGQNAVAIFPQGPVRAEDMSGGKLDEPGGLLALLTEVREVLQLPSIQSRLGRAAIPARARMGRCILSAHSGGFRVVANCLQVGAWNVNEVYLFDALYGKVDVFRDWLSATWRRRGPSFERHKLVSFFSGATPVAENRRLMGMLDKGGMRYVSDQLDGAKMSKRDLTNARAVFIRTSSSHDRVLFRTQAMRDCLFASCLERHVRSDWHKKPDATRFGESPTPKLARDRR
jgi:hypothetical protein